MKYNPRLPDNTCFLKKNMRLLQTDPSLKTIFPQGRISI